MNIPRALIPLLMGGLLLSGCAQQAPAPIADPPAAPTATATPTQTPTPEPTKPALNELVLTTEGMDYLVPGAPIEEVAPELALVSFDDAKCPGPNFDSPGRWVSTYPGDGDDDSFYLDVRDDGLYRLFISSPEILTDRGIGLGSADADVIAAYPDARVVNTNSDVTMYVVEGDAGQLTIEVARATGVGGEIGEVVHLTTMRADVDPWTVANTGAGGACQA